MNALSLDFRIDSSQHGMLLSNLWELGFKHVLAGMTLEPSLQGDSVESVLSRGWVIDVHITFDS